LYEELPEKIHSRRGPVVYLSNGASETCKRFYQVICNKYSLILHFYDIRTAIVHIEKQIEKNPPRIGGSDENLKPDTGV